MFFVAPAKRIARQPSGHALSVAEVLCMSAATPAAAGDAWLVPVIVIPSAVTDVPFAAISGSSRSP